MNPEVEDPDSIRDALTPLAVTTKPQEPSGKHMTFIKHSVHLITRRSGRTNIGSDRCTNTWVPRGSGAVVGRPRRGEARVRPQSVVGRSVH